MDTILDMKIFFLSSVCFRLLPTYIAWDNFFLLFISGNFIGVFFGEMAPVTAIMDAIYLLLSAMYNSILHASGYYPVDKIEERITFAFSHARSYLAESDDE